MVVYDGGYLSAINGRVEIKKISRLMLFLIGRVPNKSIWFNARNGNGNDGGFLEFLERIGIEPVMYWTKIKQHKCEECSHITQKYIQKGVDVGIAVRIMKELHANSFDKLVLFAGDGDFVEVAQSVIDAAKEVWIVGLSDSISTNLRMIASRVIEIDEYVEICHKDDDSEASRFAWAQIEKAIKVK